MSLMSDSPAWCFRSSTAPQLDRLALGCAVGSRQLILMGWHIPAGLKGGSLQVVSPEAISRAHLLVCTILLFVAGVLPLGDLFAIPSPLWGKEAKLR